MHLKYLTRPAIGVTFHVTYPKIGLTPFLIRNEGDSNGMARKR
jgi:hypothetical protein